MNATTIPVKRSDRHFIAAKPQSLAVDDSGGLVLPVCDADASSARHRDPLAMCVGPGVGALVQAVSDKLAAERAFLPKPLPGRREVMTVMLRRAGNAIDILHNPDSLEPGAFTAMH